VTSSTVPTLFPTSDSNVELTEENTVRNDDEKLEDTVEKKLETEKPMETMKASQHSGNMFNIYVGICQKI